MYPISKLILQAIDGSKENKLRIVKKFGYKNLSKGIRRIDRLINTGQCPESMMDKFPFALGVDPAVINRAFEDTTAQLREEEDYRSLRVEYEIRNFHPHILIKHELDKPPVGSICIVGFVGIEHWKVIQLPENIVSKPWSEQFKVVRGKIRHHQLGKDVDRSMFGRLLGYLYQRTYENSFLFSTDGSLVEIYSAKLNKLDIFISIGNQSVRRGLVKLKTA
jgi:hypothetical protein